MSDPFDHWLDADGDSTPDANERDLNRLLAFEDIAVTPFDAQLGQWPVQTVPAPLIDPLFGAADRHTYVIVHPQDFSGGATEIEASDLPCRCLFKGAAAEDRKEEAPFILQLTPDAPFTLKLFTSESTGFGHWGRATCMFVTTTALLDETWEHFRKFTRFAGEDGKWFFLRFWDGALFVDYWKYFTTSPDRVARFFYTRGFEQQFTLFLQSDGGLTRVAAIKEPSTPLVTFVKPFMLDADDFAFFQKRVDKTLKAQVVEDLNTRLEEAPAQVRSHITAAVDYAFDFVRAQSRGRPVRADDCATLSFLVLMWDTLAPDILDGPVFAEQLIPIGHRIALAKKSYFETLNDLTKGT